MKIDLTGKKAIVTGATGGIGFAIARQLAEAGAAVIVNGRTQAKVDSAVARLKELSRATHVSGAAADVSTREGCDTLRDFSPECDILVNNAGIFQPIDFFDADDEVWDRHWQVNVMSAVRL